jgi:hypothetical protein
MGVIRSPIRIGVTGHRVLADIDRITAGIEESLRRIETALPNRPLVVVSPLAEGADRLVADRVLDRHPDARLLALLPTPAEEYTKDSTSAGSRADFARLLDRATCCIELPAAGTRGASFQAVGSAVLDQSDVLIAVWDGKRGQGRGGTAGIVQIARERGLPIAWIHTGNRKPGTNESTTLGSEQGSVTFENFEAVGLASPGAKMDPPDADLTPALPYRIRIGVVAEGRVENREDMAEALALLLPTSILGFFDFKSRKELAGARYTPIAYSVLARPDAEAERKLADDVRQILAADMENAIPQERPAHLGRFMVNHCDVLVHIESPGTTSSAPDSIFAYADRKQRPVIRIRSGLPCRVRVTNGHGLNAKSIVRLDKFNGYSPGRLEVEHYIEKVHGELFGKAEGEALPPEGKELVRAMLLPYYAKASYLAKRSRRVYRRAGSLVWLLFPLAIAAAAVGIRVPSWSTAAFTLELLLLSTIAGVVTYADRHRSLQIWIETRFLAERIRCAAFLAACGFGASSIRVQPYMGGTEQRDQWMVLAFNEIWARLPLMQGCSDAGCKAIREFTKTAWVGEQIKYHEGNAKSCERKGRRLERWGTIVFLLALVAAIVHLAVPRQSHGATLLSSALAFAAILLPSVGAALGGYRNHREYSRLGKRSRNMWHELRELQERLSEADDPVSIREALSETEEAMLGETQDWLMLMRFVPVQYPG